MLVVGLTGGIASGKTAVSDAFAELGVPVIDTDIIAREQVRPGRPALTAIVARFGQACLTDDGQLDRRRLRELIFADASARAALENILHPRIDQAVRQRLSALPDVPYCLVVIPLLVETSTSHRRDYLDRVLLVDVSVALQIERVMRRDHIDRAQAQAILQVQASRAQRLASADDVIENNGSLADVAQRVAELDQCYRRLAATD